MIEIQPLYGCVVDIDGYKSPRMTFWRRLQLALFGGFMRRRSYTEAARRHLRAAKRTEVAELHRLLNAIKQGNNP